MPPPHSSSRRTHKDVGLPNDWQDNYDIAVLRDDDGHSEGGAVRRDHHRHWNRLCSHGRPVRNDIAMTGEITIMGKVLAIGGVLPKLQAAIDAGCKEVIMPKENERDVEMTPEYVRTKINVRFVTTIEEVLANALLPQRRIEPQNAQNNTCRECAAIANELRD